MRHSKYLILVLTLVISFLFVHESFGQIEKESDCVALPQDGMEIAPEAGQLLYLHDGNVQFFEGFFSTNQTFNAQNISTIYTTRISPDGRWITSLELNRDRKIEVVTRDTTGNTIFSTQVDNERISDFTWLGNQEFLTIAAYPRFTFYVYSIINPFTGEVRFVYPIAKNLDIPDFGSDSTPLFPEEMVRGGYSFSPDGRYLIGRSAGTLFDIQQGEPLELQNFRGVSVWSGTSDHVLSIETPQLPSPELENGGDIPVYFYDISEDQVERIGQLPYQPNELTYLLPNSWSPDEKLAALSRSLYDTPYSFRVEILDLSSNATMTTCFIGAEDNDPGFDFAWSRDSRYLALYGKLQGDEERETGSIYIYDIVENQIYEVYRGQADIVGWAENPQADTTS